MDPDPYPAPDPFAWFHKKFGEPTPAQREAWPRILAGENVLVASPTGTGKTFAAFLAVLDRLAADHARGALAPTLQCLYISPLRALAYDLEKNLNAPLREWFGEKSPIPIHVELRTGDTPSAQRARQAARPPHLLLTTPESLCLLLSQPKWTAHLGAVRWVIVDEIHALADNKRGAHLSVSLERLAALAEARGRRLQRIGLSATMAPLEEVAKFLCGTHGRCSIVDVSTAKKIDLKVHSPLRKNPYPEAGYTGQRLIRELAQIVRKHRTTLVFTNTRSGAEGAAFWLRGAAPELADQIECHHASLDRDVRLAVEDRLKAGELRAVVCSTSLELGIDIGSVDVVVMLATPKGVSKALQRTGRAGHDIHTVSRGILMATNGNDLVEACATVLLARQRRLDPVRIPGVALDILAQHLVSMGCLGSWTRAEALALVRRAWPFRDLTEADFNEVLDYLTGGGEALQKQYSDLFGKIEWDGDAFTTRPGRVRRDFLENVGVIPSVGMVQVRLGMKALGAVEEMFVRQLTPGDVFVIGGRPVKLERIGVQEVFVVRAEGAMPTVPRWNANKMPLSAGLAEAIRRFRGELRERIGAPPGEVTAWIAERLDCGRANAEVIAAMHLAQHALSEIPTDEAFLVEILREPRGRGGGGNHPDAWHGFFHSLIGRAANDALARVITLRLSRRSADSGEGGRHRGGRSGGNAVATPHDYGFVLTMARPFDEEELAALLSPENFEADLHEALHQSELLRYHFRNAAQTGLMVYRNYFGKQKPVRKLQFSVDVIFNVLRQHEPGHVLLREARRDAIHTFLDVDAAVAFLSREKPLRLRRVDRVPPLSFAMFATRIKEALLVEDPKETMERLYHQWWTAAQEAGLEASFAAGRDGV